MSKPYSQQQHPELREGEVWVTNSTKADYGHVGWGTKRMGQQAYDINGEPLGSTNGLYPIFAQKSELDKAGVTISS